MISSSRLAELQRAPPAWKFCAVQDQERFDRENAGEPTNPPRRESRPRENERPPLFLIAGSGSRPKKQAREEPSRDHPQGPRGSGSAPRPLHGVAWVLQAAKLHLRLQEAVLLPGCRWGPRPGVGQQAGLRASQKVTKAQWPFYQREAQWPFYQSRSNRMARPPDFNDKLHFCYYPARSVYQRPGQAIVSKSRPNGSLINARPNSRFIKAKATGWPDLRQIAFSLFSRTINLSAAGPSYSQQKQAQWPFYPREAHWPFYQSRSNRTARAPGFNDKLHFLLLSRTINLSAARPVLSKSKPNGRFIKAEATGWPDLQISTTNCIFVIIPHDQFISKASPMAVLSTRGPMAVLSRAATG